MAAVHVSYPADGVGLLVLDNPPLNFATYELMQQLHEALGTVRKAGSRVAVLASDRPGYFIAHAALTDLIGQFSGEDTSGAGTAWYRVTRELREGPMITIAANNGQAWGGGAEISWSCDLRIAAQSASYGQPESLLGIIPGAGGTTRLARLIGPTKCMEMILDGGPITSEEALRLGAINRVVPDDRLREEAIAWAARIASRPPWALEACKESLWAGLDMPLHEALRNETRLFMPTATREETLQIMRDVQSMYDGGATSREALGL